MKQLIFLALVCLTSASIKAQITWTYSVDSIYTAASPGAADLNNDGTLDVLIGGGVEDGGANSGIYAVDGSNGNLLWTYPARDEIFGMPLFFDVTSDNVPEVFISGRTGEFYCLNGSNGNLIWEIFPQGDSIDSRDSLIYNLYNPQLLPDQNGDGISDLLLANGGDASIPPQVTQRPAGWYMILDAINGKVIGKIPTPDRKETYMSPVLWEDKNKVLHGIFGSGGETVGGKLFAIPISAIKAEDTTKATILLTDTTGGYIAPVSITDMNADGIEDLVIMSFKGTLTVLDGNNFQKLWEILSPNSNTYSSPCLGQFTSDNIPDVVANIGLGMFPGFGGFTQVLVDGSTGNVIWSDTLGDFVMGSAIAVDDDGDGVDEAFIYLNDTAAKKLVLRRMDFNNNQFSDFETISPGAANGTTPLFIDVDGDSLLEIILLSSREVLFSQAPNQMIISLGETNIPVPQNDFWAGYQGRLGDGHYVISTPANIPGEELNSGIEWTLDQNKVCLKGDNREKVLISVSDLNGRHLCEKILANGDSCLDLENLKNELLILRLSDGRTTESFKLKLTSAK